MPLYNGGRIGSNNDLTSSTSGLWTLEENIRDASRVNVTETFYEISNRFIESDTYMGGSSDYDGPYDVGEVQVPLNMSGSKRVYIGVKITSGNVIFSDIAIPGVQLVSAAGTSLLASWIFNREGGGSGSGWQTTTSEIPGSSTQGFPVTPATASGYVYSDFIQNTLNHTMFSFTGGSSTNFTGADNGIGDTYKLTAAGGSSTLATVGDAQIAQTSGKYYAMRESSGSTQYSGAVMRSPTYTFSGGEYIRVIHALAGRSTDPMDPDDSLFVAVY